jgi:hypothetical protein
MGVRHLTSTTITGRQVGPSAAEERRQQPDNNNDRRRLPKLAPDQRREQTNPGDLEHERQNGFSTQSMCPSRDA